ncbi:flagellar hook-associated protein 2 [Chitinivorax tropicus]|uniref:Flagellar hook-associated protein 2 n=1 Tax=Chitinivorax tropicus TaxID=714531 RepID=A0A840MNN7_9PROT|nr:flagellar filament capping protein FliD [Chitinivorax tropicus]MBB5016861.1 flagellar hook-associated protein 2 [Chitinivorax tropicus]
MAIASPGVGSGLDVNTLITKLMQAEKEPLTVLATKEIGVQAKLSAFGTVKGAMAALQSAVRGLADASKFQASKSANSSNSEAITVTASAGAALGNYNIEVTKLAQAQKLASAGQASKNTVIGNGTLTFSFGTVSGGTFDANTGKYTGASFASNGNATKSVTIDASNNSLEGIRDAINKANIGVTASIINDGSGTPYRLALASSNPGASNSVKISVAGDTALQNLLAHDPASNTGQALQETVTAQNSELKIDGVAISKSSTSITDAIEGVTLNLLKTNVGSPAKITVSNSGSSLGTAVNAFVKAYNDLNKLLDDATAYDGSGAKAGGTAGKSAPLQGDSTVRSMQFRLRQMFGTVVAGVDSSVNSLGKVGIAFQKDGTLKVDSAKLQSAIDSKFNDVTALFAATGNATDSLVKYQGSTAYTQAGNYAVNVTSLATQGKLVGSAVTSGLTVTAGVNDSLAVTLNGKAATLTLGAGTYASVSELAAEIQSKINGNSTFAGSKVAITGTGDATSFTLTGVSDQYGSSSNFSVSGNAAALFGASPVATAGTDIVGTIGGAAATGSGQKLTASSGAALGLSVTVTGGAENADRGTISFSRGFASQLDKLLDEFLGAKGAIAARTDGLNQTVKDIGKQREVLNRRLDDTEKRYRTQFTALDVMLSNISKTGQYLSQQLAMLNR